MTDDTAKRQAELESDDEDEDAIPGRSGALFREMSSSPDLPALKKSRNAHGASTTAKAEASRRDDDGTETEASEASTDVFSDSEQLVSRVRCKRELHQLLIRCLPQESMRQPQRPISPADEQPSASSESLTQTMKSDNDRIAQSGMGAFTENKEYSIERIFTDLVFYIDTEENAKKNHLQGTANPEDDDDEE